MLHVFYGHLNDLSLLDTAPTFLQVISWDESAQVSQTVVHPIPPTLLNNTVGKRIICWWLVGGGVSLGSFCRRHVRWRVCRYPIEGTHTVHERLMCLWQVLIIVLRQRLLIITILLRLMVNLLLEGGVCLRVKVLLMLCGRRRSAEG